MIICAKGRSGKARTKIQWLKKLFQCLATLERLACHKLNKIDNNLKIIYVILNHLGFQISPELCDLDKN
jgi:hypothetical protein